MRVAERQKVTVFEIKCFKSMVGVTRINRIRNEEIQQKTGVTVDLGGRIDRKVLRWFVHMERIDEELFDKETYELRGLCTRKMII